MNTSDKEFLPTQKNYKEKVQYQKDFPTMFDFGDMKKNEEAMVSSMLSIIGRKMQVQGGYDRDHPIEISYRELANLAGGKLVRSRADKKTGKIYQYISSGKELNELVENIQKKSKSISYDVPKSASDLSKGYKSYALFVAYDVDHETQLLKVNLSEEIYQDEFIDEEGKLHEAKRVFELFYQENWSTVQYLYYNPTFHNALKSKYSMRLYRTLAKFRKNTFYRVRADDFVESVMKLETPSKKRDKSRIIQQAFEELQSARDQYDNPVFPDLELVYEKEGRKVVRYHFKFKPFSNDMLPLIGIDKQGRFIFDFGYKKVPLNDETDTPEFEEVLDKFHTVFSTDGEVDNANNRKTLKAWLEKVDKEVIIEMLNRTGYNSKRNFGWTVKGMEKLIANGIQTLKDLEMFDQQKFNPSATLTKQMVMANQDFQEIIDLLKQLLDDKIPPIILEDARNYHDKYGMATDLIATAIKETIFTGDQNKSNWKYVKGVLDNWLKEGIKTFESYENFKEQHEPTPPDSVHLSDEFLDAMDIWMDDGLNND